MAVSETAESKKRYAAFSNICSEKGKFTLKKGRENKTTQLTYKKIAIEIHSPMELAFVNISRIIEDIGLKRDVYTHAQNKT